MELKQCTGCDFIIREGKTVRDYFPKALKCCPDSNYVKLNVCSPIERAFLDEIREKFYYNKEEQGLTNQGNEYDILYQDTFTKCNLQELMEGKG